MRADSIVFAVAGVLFGVIVGWVLGSQQARPSAPAAAPAAQASSAGQAAAPDTVTRADRRAVDAPAEIHLTPTASSVHRKGEWLVPRRINVRSKASSVKLDFRHAIIGTREVDIALNDMASSVEIILPDGAISSRGHAARLRPLCRSKPVFE